MALSTSRRYPCTDARSTETCVAPVDATRDFVYFIRTSSGGGWGGGYAARLFLLFSFPFSRPRAGLVTVQSSFFGLATNTLNVRNNCKTINDIIQYTNNSVHFTICPYSCMSMVLLSTVSSTILVTVYYCGYVGV